MTASRLWQSWGRRAIHTWLAALVSMGPVRAQVINFELRTFAASPVLFADATTAAAPGATRRQLVTVKNASRKSVASVVFEETARHGSTAEIVALEHVSILFVAGETRRVSVAVGDVYDKLRSGEAEGRPVLTVVAVEFLDGTLWSAPTGSH